MQPALQGQGMDKARSNGLALGIAAVSLLARHLSHWIDLVSLLMLAPLLMCLVPVLDSLRGDGCIRVGYAAGWALCGWFVNKRLGAAGSSCW